MPYCPKCKKAELKHHHIEEGLVGYGCSVCNGILLSLVNYRSWRDHLLQPAQFKQVTNTLSETADTFEAMNCPKCSGIMTKYRASSEVRNRLDYCARCEEVWLDAGELELLHQLALDSKVATIFTEPWQRHIREHGMDKLENERLKVKFGNDYSKLTELKEWLDDHAYRDEIIAFLQDRYR